MRHSLSFVVAALTIAPVLASGMFACGDSSGTGGNASGPGTTGPSTSSTGGGGPTGSGDCSSSADCAPDGNCVALTPGGFRVCQFPIVEATMCNGQGGQGTGGGGTGGGGGGQPAPSDECCTSDDCNEICVVGPVFQQCGGPVGGTLYNVCTDDECDTAQDCDGNLCVPAGTIGNKTRQCLTTKCGADSECADEPGGTCQLVQNPCCDIPLGLYCVYPTGGCRKSSDCGAGSYCDGVGTDATCVSGAPVCPL